VIQRPILWAEGPLSHELDPVLADSALAVAMLTALPVQVALLDPDGTIRCVNQTWRDVAAALRVENPAALAEGANYLEVCRRAADQGDEIAAKVGAALQGVLRSELEFFAQEYPCNSPERRAWYLLYAVPLEMGGAVVSHIDITSRKLEEQELARKEERQRLILGSTSELISTHAAESAFVFASGAAKSLLGYEPEELLGRPLLELLHPEDLEEARRTWSRLLSGSDHERLTVRLRRRDGRYVWVETTFRALRPSGQSPSELFVAVSRDITENKEAEQQQAELRLSIERAAFEWRSTFDEIQLPILLLGLDSRIRRLNRAAAALLQKSYKDLLGRTIEELGSGQPWQAVTAVAGRVLEGYSPEICEACDEATGRTWEVEAVLSAIDDEEAKVIVQVREVTETVRLQESLRHSETMAVLGSVVGGVAHEVRNPLFGMSSVLDAFESRFGDRPEYRPYLPLLRTELSRMTGLMQALLDYGKPVRLEPCPGDPLEAVYEAFVLCRSLAERQAVELLAAGSTGRVPVLFDRNQLTQALKNVIENAVQHAPTGSSVTVEATPLVFDGVPWVRLTVRDRGLGFSPGDLAKVLEPFFSRRKGGTGLGLPIVSRIVEGHGGRLRLGNHPDGGAEVEISLPAFAHAEN
jgi:PAS domain S-box-containing protein